MDFKREILPRVVSYLIYGAIVWAVSFASGKERGEAEAQDRFRQRYEAAGSTYVQHLDRVIQDAARTTSGDDTLVRARTIVSTRDDLRRSLTSLSSLLNSEIDHLARDIKDVEALRKNGQGWKDTELRQTIDVLSRK